jgi:hypothetical protein
MNVPIWIPVRPWRIETPGIEIVARERSTERQITMITASGSIQARWILGPDGDWWQTEYPVKTAGDLTVALEVVRARTYLVESPTLLRARGHVGEDGVVVLELPKRPYSELLHELLGWSEGLMLLAEPAIEEILGALEEKLSELEQRVAELPGELVLSPDNLDGMFISPRAFGKHLAASYQRTSELLHTSNKYLLVHIGGAARHLISPLAQAGVDGIQGVCGPPQSDATLAEARQSAGPDITLWGGIAQDLLLAAHSEERFEAEIRSAAQSADADPRMILGVADRVPVEAMASRLAAAPRVIAGTAPG